MHTTETDIITTRPKIRLARRYRRAEARAAGRKELALGLEDLELELETDCEHVTADWYDTYWLDEWELRGVRRTMLRLAAACRDFHSAEAVFSRVPGFEAAPIDAW